MKIDDDVPYEIASLVGCGVMTGVGAAINTAKVVPGSSVVVFGCGGVGIAAIQGARVAGRVGDRGRRPGRPQARGRPALRGHPRGQARRARRGQGDDHRRRRLRLRLRGDRPARRPCAAAYDATRRGGTTCIIGVGAPAQTVTFNAFELFFDEKTIMGSYYGSADVRSDFARILNLWKNGRLDLEGMISKNDRASTTSTTRWPTSRPAR